MAITLPDFTALPTVTPQAGGNLLQYPQNDPGAVALGELGKGTQAAGGALVDIAAYRDIAQTKMDRATADADFTNATIPLTEQLKVETDPEKITEIRGKFRAALDAAAGNFTNPLARDYWMKGHASTVATGQAAADFRNSVVYNDKYNADVQTQINQIVRTGANAEDPVGFGASLVNINSKADAARASGSMSAVEAEKMRQKALSDMVTGRVETLIARSRTQGQAKLDEASVLVDQYTNEIGAPQAGHLRDRIAGRAETVGGQDLANRSRTGAPAPGAGGEPLIPHTPADDTLSSTGMNADQYQTFRTYLASREGKSYNLTPTPGHSRSGRYQFGSTEIAETAARLGEPVPSPQQFAADPKLQERFLENYTLDHHNQLMNVPAYRAASPQVRAGMLAGAHLMGVQGVTTYLEGKGDPVDGNGTPVSSYVRGMSGAMARGAAAPAQPAAAPAPGAPAAAPAAPGPAAPPAEPAALDPLTGNPIAAAAPPAAAPAAAPATPPAPGAAASRTPPTVAAGRGPRPIEVRGDSLGVGLKGRLNASGNAVGGAQPQAIFDDIKTEPEDHWEGQTVVLSSGTNGNQMPVVEETMQYLKDHKANVIVVGYGTKYPAKLAHLTEIATRLKIPVIDAEDDDGTHPSPGGYTKMAKKIQAAAAKFAGAPAAPAAAANPPGMIAPGTITLNPPLP